MAVRAGNGRPEQVGRHWGQRRGRPDLIARPLGGCGTRQHPEHCRHGDGRPVCERTRRTPFNCSSPHFGAPREQRGGAATRGCASRSSRTAVAVGRRAPALLARLAPGGARAELLYPCPRGRGTDRTLRAQQPPCATCTLRRAMSFLLLLSGRHQLHRARPRRCQHGGWGCRGREDRRPPGASCPGSGGRDAVSGVKSRGRVDACGDTRAIRHAALPRREPRSCPRMRKPSTRATLKLVNASTCAHDVRHSVLHFVDAPCNVPVFRWLVLRVTARVDGEPKPPCWPCGRAALNSRDVSAGCFGQRSAALGCRGCGGRPNCTRDAQGFQSAILAPLLIKCQPLPNVRRHRLPPQRGVRAFSRVSLWQTEICMPPRFGETTTRGSDLPRHAEGEPTKGESPLIYF